MAGAKVKKLKGWGFIVNPSSGGGRAAACAEKAAEFFKGRLEKPAFAHTEAAGDGTALALKMIKNKITTLVAIGGDGTVNEVLQGLMASGRAKGLAFGIVPTGSGNDYAAALGLSETFRDGDWMALAEARTEKVDVGVCNGKYLLNGVGVGFDAKVASDLKREGFFKGKNSYRWNVLKNLFVYRPCLMKMEYDGRKVERMNLMLTIGIGRRFGGGFYLTPEALINDGLYDVCMIKNTALPGRISKLMAVTAARHAHIRGVEYFRASRIGLEYERPVEAHIDGECFMESRFDIAILPRALSMIINPRHRGFFAPPRNNDRG